VLYDLLTSKGLKVWLDSECLSAGLDWEEGFCKGLITSAFFVTLLSREAINSDHANRKRCNIACMDANSPCDNVLLEWRLALELKDRGMLSGIFPVMIGDELTNSSDAANSQVQYGNYFGDFCHPNVQSDVAIAAVEAKLRRHLDREGFGLPLEGEVGVKSLLTRITSNQGGFIQGGMQDAFEGVATSIVGMCATENTQTHTDTNDTTSSIDADVELVAYKRQITALQGEINRFQLTDLPLRDMQISALQDENKRLQLQQLSDVPSRDMQISALQHNEHTSSAPVVGFGATLL
jgi:hypothetical protein